MKKTLVSLFVLVLLLTLGVSVAIAGSGDPVPGVEYNPSGVSCGVPAGDWGWFSTFNWWWATYSNDRGILKCLTHLDNGQAPPSVTVTVPGSGYCATPGGITEDFFTRVFPDGAVHLICRVH